MNVENSPSPASRSLPRSELVERLLGQALEIVRAASQEQLPEDSLARQALNLYRANEANTTLTGGALLSALHSCARAGSFDLEQPADLVAALLIHETHKRLRRREYRDRQMKQQIANARRRDADGEMLRLDLPSPEDFSHSMENLWEEIEVLAAQRSERDRLVLELWLKGERTGEEIVTEVLRVQPTATISQPTVSRIVRRFRDELCERRS